MWEEEKEFDIYDDIENYESEYDNTDCFSCLDLSLLEEGQDLDDDDDYLEDEN